MHPRQPLGLAFPNSETRMPVLFQGAIMTHPYIRKTPRSEQEEQLLDRIGKIGCQQSLSNASGLDVVDEFISLIHDFFLKQLPENSPQRKESETSPLLVSIGNQSKQSLHAFALQLGPN